MWFKGILEGYRDILYFIAEIAVHTLELTGIFIIFIGSIRAIAQIFAALKRKRPTNIAVNLGRTLALALEFKMGAEIVNTVIVRNLNELGILAIVIALRAILALLIRWEIENDKKDEEGKKKTEESIKGE